MSRATQAAHACGRSGSRCYARPRNRHQLLQRLTIAVTLRDLPPRRCRHLVRSGDAQATGTARSSGAGPPATAQFQFQLGHQCHHVGDHRRVAVAVSTPSRSARTATPRRVRSATVVARRLRCQPHEAVNADDNERFLGRLGRSSTTCVFGTSKMCAETVGAPW